MKTTCSTLALIILPLILQAESSGDTTINVVNKNGYGANIGWIDARGNTTNGAYLTQFYCTGYVWSANCGWIHLGKGPTNGFQYSNTSADDYGVNIQGSSLRGYAYGANIGWINFETNGNPRIDLLSGKMNGHAWGANVGWISLSNSFAHVQTDCLEPGLDTDGDGIPDAWELSQSGDLVTYGPYPDDDDLDGKSDLEEYLADTNPGKDNSYLRITDIDHLVPTSQVTWTVSPARLYLIEKSESATNESAWVDSGLGLVAPEMATSLTRDILDPASTTRFFRAKAVVPLQKP